MIEQIIHRNIFFKYDDLKNKINEQKKIEEVSQVQRIHWWSPDGRGVRRLGEKGDEMEKNESVVTQWSQDEKHSWGIQSVIL